MTDLFEAQPVVQTPAEQAPAPTADPLLATIVNEDGKPKYSSVPEALKALAHAQAHLKTLETENSQLREATTKATTLEEVLSALKPSEAAPAPKQEAPKEPERVDIASVVAQQLAKIESEKVLTANVQSVVEKVQEAFGEKASEQFYTKSAELGFTKEQINRLAADNPKAVLKLLGIEDKKPTKNLQGSIRTDALITPPDIKTKSGMSHGNTRDLVDAWRVSANKVNEKLGIK